MSPGPVWQEQVVSLRAALASSHISGCAAFLPLARGLASTLVPHNCFVQPCNSARNFGLFDGHWHLQVADLQCSLFTRASLACSPAEGVSEVPVLFSFFDCGKGDFGLFAAWGWPRRLAFFLPRFRPFKFFSGRRGLSASASGGAGRARVFFYCPDFAAACGWPRVFEVPRFLGLEFGRPAFLPQRAAGCLSTWTIALPCGCPPGLSFSSAKRLSVWPVAGLETLSGVSMVRLAPSGSRIESA